MMRALRKTMRTLLAAVLALYLCLPTAALAAEAGGAPSSAIASMQTGRVSALASGTDLNAAWKAQAGGFSSAFTISKNGTYYLSGDLKADAGLVIDAPDKNVTLNLNGHTLTLDGMGSGTQKTMLSITAAGSVEISGSEDGSGKGAIVSAGGSDVWGISSTAANCLVYLRGVGVKLSSDATDQRNLATHAIRMTGTRSTLRARDCSFEMLMGNQAFSSSSLVTCSEVPSAVYATSAVTRVQLTDCSATAEGTKGFGCDLADTTSVGNAYAVYSAASETYITGGSFRAVSPLGNATCLYGRNLEIDAQVSLEAGAGQLACGVLSTSSGGVTLDAPLSFEAADCFAGQAEAEAALRSTVDSGFGFGDCAPASGSSATYTALVMHEGDDLTSANSSGYVIGTLSGSQAAAVCAALRNALGRGCFVENASNAATFAFDEASPADAAAEVNGSYYATLGSALRALADGGTIKLLEDVGVVRVSGVTGAVVDLNQKTARALEYSDAPAGAGLTVKNGTVSGAQSAGGVRSAVYHHAAAPLVLDNVKVRAAGTDASVYGVYGAASAGELTVRGSDISAAATSASSGSSAYGIGMADDGPVLVLSDSKVRASTGSAGASVCGVSCTNGATVRDCDIAAAGTTVLTGAMTAYGAVAVERSSLTASSTDLAASSNSFGIWGRTSGTVATDITVDSCSIEVASGSGAISGTSACLLGSTSEASASDVSWTLAGASKFKSDSGLHLGLNLGSVSLRGFSLDSSGGFATRLLMSQAQREGNVAFAVSGAGGASLDDLAGLFRPAKGSYYEGWSLASDAGASRLVWRPSSAASNAVTIVRDGAEQGAYPTLAAALAEAQSQDTLRLDCDLGETGAQVVRQDSLTLDLNGHELTVRAGGMDASTKGSFDALVYSGAGALVVKGGVLALNVGASGEAGAAASVPYQGIAVTGGGTARVEAGAEIDVNYTGGTGASAAQRSLTLRGVAVADGALDLMSGAVLNVSSSPADGGKGALTTYGIYAQSGTAAAVRVASGAQVIVDASSAPMTAKNAYYAETTYNATTNDGPTGLREIEVDPKADAQFYADLVKQFRLSATYDDPEDTTTRNILNLGIYYAHNMVLEPEDESAWYNGLRVWAYSDVVAKADVGKKKSIVPAHVFVSSYYDTLPQAYGIATADDAPTGATVSVEGAVDVVCPHGEAYALSAGGKASWTCDGASLSATADDEVHPVSRGELDLRDYIALSSTQEDALHYIATDAANAVEFAAPVARDVVVGESASFKFEGAPSLSAAGLDATNVQNAKGAAFALGSTFSGFGGRTCAIANGEGANAQGETFATGAGSGQAALFADAYGAYAPALEGTKLVWGRSAGYTVTFKIGDAVVARYANPSSIDLSEPSAAAKRPADQRQSYTLQGWSRSGDENAATVDLATSGTATFTEGATYYAVYGQAGTARVNVPVTFTNLHSADGSLAADVSIAAVYGQTVSAALGAKGIAMPAPQDYTDAASGLTYRFIGWHPYASSSASSAKIYDSDKVGGLEVTLSTAGVSTTGLMLRAVYVAAEPSQHLVTFMVDGYASSCLVDDGAVPAFTQANRANTNYVVPAKQETVAGTTFTFDKWFVDADGDGVCGDGEAAYESVLPRVTGDVTYTAAWTSEYADVTLTFYVKYVDESSGQFHGDGWRVITTTSEKTTQEVADSVQRIGGKVGYGGKVYTLLGWSSRKGDVDPVYDAENPLPNVTGDDRAISNAYAKTFYGVYKTDDHVVTVTFKDGGTTLGTATRSSLSSIADAFAATRAATPVSKSAKQQFLGWAKTPNAANTDVLDSTSTTLDEAAGTTADSVTLYAVYGVPAVYPVRLRNADGTQVLYRLSVKHGKTVREALTSAGVAVPSLTQEGCYFAGWRTAAGKYFGLDKPVTGSLDLYATFNPVTVESSAAGVGAVVTTNDERFEQASSLKFTVVARESADTPIRNYTAENSYSIMRNYDIRLVMTDANGVESVVTGDFGTASITVRIGTKYKKSTVRAFWLGSQNGGEAVLFSDKKTADDNGDITVGVGNYLVGDVDEGGNFCIAYIEGESSDSTLGTDKGNSGLGTSGTGLGASTSGLGGVSASGLASGAGVMTLGANSAGGFGSGSGSAGSAGGAGGLGNGGADGASADGAGDDGVGAEGEGASMTGEWGTDGVVLVILAVLALAAMVYGLWRAIVVKQRRDEEDEEFPVMSDQYARGVHF